MTAPNPEGAPGGGPPLFPINFVEVSLLYSILYERSKCLPTREQMLDEIERRELYPTNRHVIPHAMDQIEETQGDMREFLVSFAGEMSVIELEKRVDKAIEKLKGS